MASETKEFEKYNKIFKNKYKQEIDIKSLNKDKIDEIAKDDIYKKARLEILQKLYSQSVH